MFDREDAPVILFELNSKAARAFGGSSQDYFTFLESLGHAKYSYFEVLPNEIKPLKCWEIEYTNIVAIPASRNWK